MTTTTILEEVEKLPVAEQLAIAEAILHRIRAEIQEAWEDAEDVRLTDERLARLARGETRPLSHEEVWTELGNGGELPD